MQTDSASCVAPTNRAEVKNTISYLGTFSHQFTRKDSNLFSQNNLWRISLFQIARTLVKISSTNHDIIERWGYKINIFSQR